MAVFMVVLAVATPLLRLWDETMRRFFMLFVLLNLAAVGIGVFVNIRRRLRVERIAGAVLLRVVTRRARVMQITYFSMAVGTVVLLAVWSSVFARFAVDPLTRSLLTRDRYWMAPLQLMNLLAYAYWLATYCCFLWWNTGPWTVEICQDGLINGGLRLCLFSSVKEVRWGTYQPNNLRINREGHGRWDEIVIPPDQREKVETIIRDRMAAAQSA